MKKYLALSLILAAAVCSFAACTEQVETVADEAEEVVEEVGEEVEEAAEEVEEAAGEVEEAVEDVIEEAEVIKLGTSNLTIAPEKKYVKGEISEEDTDENQVAYYKSEETLVDFDVYQWAKASDETLADAAAEEAALYEAEAEETEINGLKAAFYKAVEESDGTEYNTVSYMVEDGDYIVELVFWLDGDDAEAEVEAILSTLTQVADEEAAEGIIELGTSGLTIAPEKAYVKGEISEEDTDEAQVAYYYSEDTLVDFDVYEWAKADGETLTDAAAEEAALYEAEAEETTINDLPVAFYKAVEEIDGEEYNTVSYMIDNGDEFVEIVFWLDGENAEAEVEAIMATLAK